MISIGYGEINCSKVKTFDLNLCSILSCWQRYQAYFERWNLNFTKLLDYFRTIEAGSTAAFLIERRNQTDRGLGLFSTMTRICSIWSNFSTTILGMIHDCGNSLVRMSKNETFHFVNDDDLSIYIVLIARKQLCCRSLH